ncbi:MAG TPA: hypothetical protein VMS78_11855 [Rhizomicrobium sp.]|nr:hypothetical protein [Rhizomicrobium sp.]
MVSDSIAGIPPPDIRPARPPSTTSLEIVAESLAMLRRSVSQHWSIWLVAAFFFTGTNIVDIVFGTRGNPFQSPLMVASLFVRVVSYVMVVVAALRTFTGGSSIWKVDQHLLRCAGAFFGLFALSIALLLLFTPFVARPVVEAVTADHQLKREISVAMVAVWFVLFAIVTIRLSPWIVALAVGDNSIGLRSAWKRMRGATLAGIGALIWTAPVPIAHLALTAEAQYLSGSIQLSFTVVDGLVSVLQVMIALAIAVALYNFAKKNKPAT